MMKAMQFTWMTARAVATWRGVMQKFGTRALCFVVPLIFTLAVPLVALAADEESDVPHDARTLGYPQDTPLSIEGGTALTWLLFVFLGILALAALFKDAKRTHLD